MDGYDGELWTLLTTYCLTAHNLLTIYSLSTDYLRTIYSPSRVHYPGLHPCPGGEAVAGGERLLLERGDGAAHLGQRRHRVLQPEHPDTGQPGLYHGAHSGKTSL